MNPESGAASRDSEHEARFRLPDGRLLTRRQILRGVLVGGATVAAAPLLAACGSTGAKSSGGGGGGTGGGGGASSSTAALTWAMSTAVRGLDPAKSADNYSFMLDSLFYDTLVTYDANEKVIPNLAKSWSYSSDLKTYTYKLRSGIKFWDGSPLTTDDVVYSFTRNMDPKVGSQISSFFSNVKSVEATGTDEVTVSLHSPDILFQYIPTFTFILNKAFVEKQGANYGTSFSNGSSKTVLATGPYIPSSFNADTGIKLEKNSSYWGSPAKRSKMSVTVIANDSTRQLAIRSGQVQGTFDVPLQAAENWTKTAGAELVKAEGLTVYFISLDVTAPPFDDVHVRRAIAHCLDLQGLVKSLLGGNGTAANSLVPPAMWSGMLSQSEVKSLYASLPTYPFSLKKAKAELKKSRYANGFKASVPYPSNVSSIGDALQTLSQNLKTIGATLDVKEVTSNEWLNTIYAHKNLGMQVMTWFPDYPDPADYLQYFYPSSAAAANQFNMANFKDPTVDQLINKQQGLTSASARTQAIKQVMQISQEQLPYIGLWWEDVVAAVKGVKYSGLTPLYYDQPWFRDVS